jgi:hypothetical protein
MAPLVPLGTPSHRDPHPFIGQPGRPCESCSANEAHPTHITHFTFDQPVASEPVFAAAEYFRIRKALEAIRDLPATIGKLEAHPILDKDAAIGAVAVDIATKALAEGEPL